MSSSDTNQEKYKVADALKESREQLVAPIHKKLDKEDALIHDLYASNLDVQTFAEKVGMPARTLYHLLKRRGVPLPKYVQDGAIL